jgi:LytS/YehU family sensor histidine kinase
VNLDLEEPQYDYTIEPMLYLTLVENAFKHGAQSDISQGWVNIKGKTTKDGYALFVENSTVPKTTTNKAGGIGLSNLRKRLDLIYQGKYQLDIVQDEHQFSVSLILTLSHA